MPPTNSASPGYRKRYCGLGNHHLRPPYKTISDQKMLRFAKHINPELRTTTLLCGSCYETLQKIFRVKVVHAKQLHKKKSTATTTISDVSSSQQPQIETTSESVSAYSTASVTSTTTSLSSQQSPNTSKRKRTAPVTATDTSDDDESLSLNAVNGTRLPNVQPVPKRRQFVHLNKDVMNIYLAGTTGG